MCSLWRQHPHPTGRRRRPRETLQCALLLTIVQGGSPQLEAEDCPQTSDGRAPHPRADRTGTPDGSRPHLSQQTPLRMPQPGQATPFYPIRYSTMPTQRQPLCWPPQPIHTKMTPLTQIHQIFPSAIISLVVYMVYRPHHQLTISPPHLDRLIRALLKDHAAALACVPCPRPDHFLYHAVLPCWRILVAIVHP